MAATTSRKTVGETIPDRYAGFCKSCGQQYQIGDPITKSGFKTWVHQACYRKVDAQANAPVTFATPQAAAPTQTQDPQVGQAAEAVRNAIRATIRQELEGATLAVDEAEVRTVVRDEMLKGGIIKHEIQIKGPGVEIKTIKGKAHAKFERVLRLAACRRNLLLVGPAGCGKTHLAEQAAEALGLSFAFLSCSAGMSEGQLLGRLVPTGEAGTFEYLRSEFVKAYEEGGMFLFDELDAADSNTLLVINSALANGQMAVPNRPEKPFAVKHPDFICMAAANTYGTGADRQYVGRNQLDESTLDRFRIGQIALDYDFNIEEALCPDDSLRTRLQGYRARCREAKLRRLVSMRFMRDAYITQQAGDTGEEIDEALFAGWSKDEIAKVKHS